jgi:hypothetical protein
MMLSAHVCDLPVSSENVQIYGILHLFHKYFPFNNKLNLRDRIKIHFLSTPSFKNAQINQNIFNQGST